jgi:curved DNA-binding protein CbpA
VNIAVSDEDTQAF